MKQPQVLLSAFLILVLTAAALAFVSGRATFLSLTQPAATAPSHGLVAAPNRGPRQVVQFTLYDAGIHPHEARVDHGIVVLLLEDLAGGTVGLVIERENDGGRETIGEVRRAERSWRGKREMRLTPGRYQVYDAARPNNRALLIVEP